MRDLYVLPRQYITNAAVNTRWNIGRCWRYELRMELRRERTASLFNGTMAEEDMGELVYGSVGIWVGRTIKHLSSNVQA